MDLFEYQGKQYFARFDIPVSPGDVAYTVDEALAAAEMAGYPVVVKAQVQVGGRGKAGGIKLANNADEVRTHAGNIIGMDIKGHLVKRVWVEHASDISKEYYASYSLDRGAKKHLLMLSAQGGVEIEAVAESNPDAIVMLHIDPVDGISLATARDAAVRARIDAEAVDGVASMLVKLYACFTQGDCDLAEINPLILRPDGGVHALDAKVSLDNNAGFRHPEWDEFRATEELDAREQLAREHDLQYIGLDGTVGIIANGAGLGKAQGQFPADATARAGDDGHPALEIEEFHGGKSSPARGSREGLERDAQRRRRRQVPPPLPCPWRILCPQAAPPPCRAAWARPTRCSRNAPRTPRSGTSRASATSTSPAASRCSTPAIATRR